MSKEFNIIKDYWNKGDILFKKNKFNILPNLTVLVGCNGSGKTTMLRQIKSQLKDDGIKYIYFDNLDDGGQNARSKAGYFGDLDFLASGICSSEGENIMLNISNIIGRIGSDIRKNSNIDEYWILLDAVDSGLSIDGIIQLKEVFDFIINDNKNKDIYIVVVANEYELARNENCFDVTNCKYIKFKDYEEYRDFIIKSKEYKNKRYDK